MSQNAPKRTIVYTKDVENITGRRPRTARKILQQIRKKLGKEKGGLISVSEFAEHLGISEDDVRSGMLY